MNKKHPAGQLATQERRHTCIRRLQDARDSTETGMTDSDVVEPAPLSFQRHHHLSDSARNVFNLAEYLVEHRGDPALKVGVKHSDLILLSGVLT